MQFLLETDRLALRRFTKDDIDLLFDLDNDPEVMRFINGGTPTSRDIIRGQILPVFLRYDEQFPAYGFWVTRRKSTMHSLGWCCMRPTEADNEVSIGYRFRQSAWGRGYATESTRALINKGFAESGVQRVIATAYEDNLASRRVMEKLGLKLVRRFRVELVDQDTAHFESSEPWDGDDLEYALGRDEWERQSRSKNGKL